MTTVDRGLFRLVDPPASMLPVIEATLDAIDFPWHRLIPRLRSDPDQRVVVRWVDTMQQSSGKFDAGTYEIHLSTQPYHQDPVEVGFVFAHEIGHVVDFATLLDREKSALLALFNADLSDGNPYLRHDDPAFAHSEYWRNSGDAYPERVFEAYADQFVATFAPTIWAGRFPRFVHWTDDHAAVRRITLERTIMAFTDVPEDHPHREGIEWAAGEGLVSGYADGTFKPEDTVKRGQLCTILHRQATA